MKKLIKIFSLLMFILLVFGITTSNAADFKVDKDTTADNMLYYLDERL